MIRIELGPVLINPRLPEQLKFTAHGGKLAQNEGGRHPHGSSVARPQDLRMAARYQHLSPAFLADAVSHLDKAFGVSDAFQSVERANLVEKRLEQPEPEQFGPLNVGVTSQTERAPGIRTLA
jgi:hypothetical protein